MSQTIIINSVNYDGEQANVLFTPDNDPTAINLGTVILPYTFNPGLLTPPREVYGTYSILTIENQCFNLLNVPRPTPSPTPTKTPTRTPTPTPSITPTVTPTSFPCITRTPTPTPGLSPTPTPTSTPSESPTPTPSITSTVTPTPTVTPTIGTSPTPTPTITSTPTVTPTVTPTITPTATVTPTITPTSTPFSYQAYLFIEPESGDTAIGQYMYDSGSNFFGFTNLSLPSTNSTQFNIDMNTYVSYSGWSNGSFPTVISQNIPTTSGGFDSFGNPIVAYNFFTTRISSGTIGSTAWYTWIIPVDGTNFGIQTEIGMNSVGVPNLLPGYLTSSSVYSNTFTYSGGVIPAGTYRVYTTAPNEIFRLTNTYDIYFKGNDVQP